MSRLDRVDVAALGDSMTYGANVPSHRSWPAQLASLTDTSVYNFGVGSYGILQYYESFLMALQKHPKHIVLAFLISNDLEGGYCEVVSTPHWLELARKGTIERGACRDEPARATPAPAADARWAVVSAARYYANNLEAIAKARIFVAQLRGRLDQPDHPSDYYELGAGEEKFYVRKERVRGLRAATDRSDPVIDEASRNAFSLLSRMNEIARQRGISFGVVLLPTKPRVCARWALRHRLRIPARYQADLAVADELMDAFQTFFDLNGIDHVEPMSEMVELLDRATRSGEIVFPMGNGHPMDNGYGIYAAAARKLIDRAPDNIGDAR